MNIDVSVLLPLRNAEPAVAELVRNTGALLRGIRQPHTDDPVSFEIVALDEGSVDNTLSVLSVLHRQVEHLRTIQDLVPGTAIVQGSRVARGETWVIVDRNVDDELVRWGLSQVLAGQPAAIVRGELLVVQRDVGMSAFTKLDGGLVTAQRAVSRLLRQRGEQATRSPGPDRGVADRAFVYVRAGLGRLGLGWLDRPLSRSRGGRGSPEQDGLL